MTPRRPAPQPHLPMPATAENGAQRRAARPLMPTKPQDPCDVGLFSDDALQLDLVELARKP